MIKKIVFLFSMIFFLSNFSPVFAQNSSEIKKFDLSSDPLILNKTNELRIGLSSFTKEEYEDIDVITMEIEPFFYNEEQKMYQPMVDINKTIEFDSLSFYDREKWSYIPLVKKVDYLLTVEQRAAIENVDYNSYFYKFDLLNKEKLYRDGYLTFTFKNIFPIKKEPLKAKINLYKGEPTANFKEEGYTNIILYGSSFGDFHVFEDNITPTPTLSNQSRIEPWVKDLKAVHIPVSADVTLNENSPNQGYPYALAAHPYLSPTQGEQIILLQFPLKDGKGDWYVPKSSHIYQVALSLYEVAGYSKKESNSVSIQLFTVENPQNQKIDQMKINWQNMPKLGRPFFTAEIPIAVYPLSLFDIKSGFEVFHQEDQYQYATFAIRIPPFETGYIQFADKDSLYKNQTFPSLTVSYLDYPLPTPTSNKNLPPEEPFNIRGYFDRLTKGVVVSWKTNSNVNKIQIERNWTDTNRYLTLPGNINTYLDLDVVSSFFSYYPQNSVTYGIRSCHDISFDNNCLYSSRIVYSEPIACDYFCRQQIKPITFPPSPSSYFPSPTPSLLSPSPKIDKKYQEKIKQFEEKIKTQERSIKKLEKEVKRQKNLLEKILFFIKTIFNRLFK